MDPRQHGPLDPPLIGLEKLTYLAAAAIRECLPAIGSVPPAEIPLLLGVAEPERPGDWANLTTC